MIKVGSWLDYSIRIQEWDGSEKAWIPYVAEDVQLEVEMIQPFVRRTLQHQGEGRYYTSFQVPDVFGIFKLQVQYTRQGIH